MARVKREISGTGIYHVMTRGNNKNDIFIDNEDKKKYVNILQEKKEVSKCYLYAYCIMTNHSHLIIKEETEALSNIMKRINISYASYFNKKYGKIGHVFQDRYLSEPIEDDGYLLAAVRYIHNNPVKANLSKSLDGYSWSSYKEYTGKAKNNLSDTQFVLSLFSPNNKSSIKLFKEFSIKDNDDKFLDVEIEKVLEIKSFNDAKVYIGDYLNSNSLKLEDLGKPDSRQNRNEIILYLRNNSDLSIRDIAGLLHIGRNMVANAK